MSHNITSEDNWLVQCLFLASFGAILYFGVSSGWLLAQLGVTQAAANVYNTSLLPAPVAPVLVSETKEMTSKDTSKDISHSKTTYTSDVPDIMLSGLKEGQQVTGMLYVTVLPKQFSSVSDIELQLNGEVQASKEADSSTYALDTATLPAGTHTIMINVRGVAAEEEISLQKNVTFVVAAAAAKATVDIAKEKTVIKDTVLPDQARSAKGKPTTQSIVTTDRINVRSEPFGQIIGQRNAGMAATPLIEKSVKAGNFEWLEVLFTDGLQGYVATDFVRENNSSETTRAVSPPAATEAVDIQALQTKIAALELQLAEIQAQLKLLLE